MEISRRALLGAAAVGALSACAPSVASPPISPAPTSGTTSPSQSSPSAPTSAGEASPTSVEPAPALPRHVRWDAGPGEVEPGVKTLAVRLLETAGTWRAGGGTLAAASARLKAAGFRPSLVDALGPLLGAGTDAVANVRHAHYGGILDYTASVLTVVDQWRSMPNGTLHVGGTTIDVRLERLSQGWTVVDAIPAEVAPASSELSAAAKQVLASKQIRLPHAAHVDVRAGLIHDSVLEMLLGLASGHVIDVAVLKSGHPAHVFGTSRMSDHPKGRAADLWAIDGHDIVRPANYALTTSVMEQASRLGAYQVGGPVQLDGSGFFSDATHQDHIHAGFTY